MLHHFLQSICQFFLDGIVQGRETGFVHTCNIELRTREVEEFLGSVILSLLAGLEQCCILYPESGAA